MVCHDPRASLLPVQSRVIEFRRDATPLVIPITGGPADGHDVLRVRDNGVGFDPSEADRIFEPFERPARRGAVGGTGIGLATVRRIAEIHGARVRAEGVAGEGATFIVEWPRQASRTG